VSYLQGTAGCDGITIVGIDPRAGLEGCFGIGPLFRAGDEVRTAADKPVTISSLPCTQYLPAIFDATPETTYNFTNNWLLTLHELRMHFTRLKRDIYIDHPFCREIDAVLTRANQAAVDIAADVLALAQCSDDGDEETPSLGTQLRRFNWTRLSRTRANHVPQEIHSLLGQLSERFYQMVLALSPLLDLEAVHHILQASQRAEPSTILVISGTAHSSNIIEILSRVAGLKYTEPPIPAQALEAVLKPAC